MKAKSLMAKVDPFLESLIHYDKENIHPNIIAALEPYLKDKEFDPDFIRYCMISILSQIAFPTLVCLINVLHILFFFENFQQSSNFEIIFIDF